MVHIYLDVHDAVKSSPSIYVMHNAFCEYKGVGENYLIIYIYIYIQLNLSIKPPPQIDHSSISISLLGSQTIAHTIPL